MSRIKPTEVKDGDSLESSAVNQAQSDIRGLEINRANVRQEGLTADVIESGTVFDSPETAGFNISGTISTLRTDPGFLTGGPVLNGGVIQNVTVEDLDGAEGEKIIVRVSCRIKMNDYGARTFNDMLCPIIDMRLRRAQVVGLGSTVSGAVATNYTNECSGTRQQFELAWSGKIPSSAVSYGIHGSMFAGTGGMGEHTDNAANSAYVGTGGTSDDNKNEFALSENARGRTFDYDFVYQTSWLFDPGSTKYGQVHFALFGFADLRNTLAPILGASVGGADGAGQVSYPGFNVRYMHMSAIRVRR